MVDGLDRLGVIRDQIVLAQQGIYLTGHEFKCVGVETHRMQHGVDVLAPIVNLGDVAFAQDIVDHERMEAKDRLYGPRHSAHKDVWESSRHDIPAGDGIGFGEKEVKSGHGQKIEDAK